MALIVATALCPARRTVRLALVGIFVTAAATAAFGWAQSGDERIFHFVDNDEHIQLLRNDVELIARNPLGYGVGTTDTVARRFNLNAIDQQVDNVSIGPSAESVFLGRAVEGGALGMVMFLVLLFWTGMRLRAARLRSLEAADREGAAAAAGALGALIGVSVAGLLLPTQDLSISTAVWGAAGCALVMTGERAFSTAPRWTLAHLLGRAASRPA